MEMLTISFSYINYEWAILELDGGTSKQMRVPDSSTMWSRLQT
jgi:hypothetical protein